jgi:GT2 family glycosyltransferase
VRDDAPVKASYGCIVLTQGDRGAELWRALASVRDQEDVHVDVVVVFNGAGQVDLPDPVHHVELVDNVGAPGGRNAGVASVGGELLLFLDDDAWLTPQALRRIAELFAADPRLGMVQPRVTDPDGGPAPRRWVPRVRVGDPRRSSDVCAVWEGAVIMRRTAYEASGGWPDTFFLGHEGIELTWRVWDSGFRVHYRGDVEVHHPVVELSRHPHYRRTYGRNRVWIARRNLPVPLAVVYCATWLAIDLARSHTAAAPARSSRATATVYGSRRVRGHP